MGVGDWYLVTWDFAGNRSELRLRNEDDARRIARSLTSGRLRTRNTVKARVGRKLPPKDAYEHVCTRDHVAG